jgi:hypothetical protein
MSCGPVSGEAEYQPNLTRGRRCPHIVSTAVDDYHWASTVRARLGNWTRSDRITVAKSPYHQHTPWKSHSGKPARLLL